MKNFKLAGICLNGHVENYVGQAPSDFSKHCSKCGADIIYKCPHSDCEADIRGKEIHKNGAVMAGNYERPNYCHECGKEYPWTNKEGKPF